MPVSQHADDGRVRHLRTIETWDDLAMDQIAPEHATASETEARAEHTVLVRRRRRWPWIVGAIVLIGLLCGAAQMWANLSYDDAADAFGQARTSSEPATTTLIATLDHADETAAAAKSVEAVTTPELFSDENRTALAAATDDLTEARADADGIGVTPPPAAGDKPVVPWELFLQASDLQQRTAELHARTDDQDSAARLLSTAIADIDALGGDILRTAREAVPAIEAAAVHARVAPILALRKAADTVKRTESDFDGEAATSLLQLDEAVAAVRASAKSELAAKDGPLYDARLKAEDYARSISGGVLLEFDWTDRLLGQGAGQSGAGTATWNSEDGGTSLITLTNSIATYWPADWTRSLVAHEVGHSISAKCYEMFDWEDEHANEQWATAWAMSWGYSAFDSGADQYGVPSAEMQKAAASCR